MAILTVKETKARLEKEGIIVSKDFCERAERERNHFGQILLTENDLIQALIIAKFWKRVLKRESDYDKLVMHIVYRLYKIHCVAITTSAACNYYIGNLVEVKDSASLFKDIVTTAMSTGDDAHFVSTPARYYFEESWVTGEHLYWCSFPCYITCFFILSTTNPQIIKSIIK